MWFYWSVVALNAVEFLWQAYIILADRWREKSALQHMAMEGLGLIPIAILIVAPGQAYVAANPLATHTLPAGLTVGALNHYGLLAFEVAAMIKVVQFAWELWKGMAGTKGAMGQVL